MDGLLVTVDDIWVDSETGFSLFSDRGRLIAHHNHEPMRSCDTSAPAHRYGGITSAGGRVFIANRCHPSISVYARNGQLETTVRLPGKDFPRGVTYGAPQAGRPAMLYVAIPDRGQVLAYRASSLGERSRPADILRLARPGGGTKPQPAGIAVNRWGQLTVSDMANNAIYLFDANHDFSHYRTLGHPPRASRDAGRLSGPSAIAQYDQDGSGLSGNLFIADTNNHRVQRWNTSGYTYWSKTVRAALPRWRWKRRWQRQRGCDGGGNGDGGDGSGKAPVNISPPTILGSAAVGQNLSAPRAPGTATPPTATSGGVRVRRSRWPRIAIFPELLLFFPWPPSAIAESRLRGGRAQRALRHSTEAPSRPAETLPVPQRELHPCSETG